MHIKKVTIDYSDNRYHIHGQSYWFNKQKITPLYQTCSSYEDCIKWLDNNLKEYTVVKNS